MTRVDRSEDLELLIDVLRRSPLLEELQAGELDRAELQDRLDISKSTGHRHTRLLRELGVIEKERGTFRLTQSGSLLTDAMVRFKREAHTALQLAPLLDAIQDAPAAIDVEEFAGATVTNAEHGDPYSPVARFVALVQETETLRGFDVDVIAPIYMDEIQRRIVDGMETETIGLPAVAKNALDDYPEKCMEACASGNLTIRLCENLPFGVAIFDERVGIGVCERDSRQLRLFADTESPAVREWAETVYEYYESEAVLLEEFTHDCFDEVMETQTLTS